MSNASVFHLGLSLVGVIEIIHESGIVYNDLKPDNILISFCQKVADTYSDNIHDDIFENVDLNLVDFGLATEW